MLANFTRRQAFSPSCPAGGTWWSCGYGTFFVGCCARDPCEITCAQGNLYPGAFDLNAYGTFPDATCGTGSKFYTCTAGATFWGCCKTNACAQSGCPDGDLEPAILNRDDLLSAYHATGGSTTAFDASSTSVSTDISTSTPASPSTTALATAESKVPVAAIAGGAAGGAFALAIVSGFVIWFLCIRRKKWKNHKDRGVVEQRQDMPPIGGMTQNQHPLHKSHDAPPSYTSPTAPFTTPFYTPHHDLNHTITTINNNNPAHQPPHSPTWPPLPLELPLTTPSNPRSTPPQFLAHKSVYGHTRGPSELSGDGMPSELDTAREMKPESPVLGKWARGKRGGDGWGNGSGSGGGGEVGKAGKGSQMWMAPRDWGSGDAYMSVGGDGGGDWGGGRRVGRESSGMQRLGVLDAMDEEVERGGREKDQGDEGRRDKHKTY